MSVKNHIRVFFIAVLVWLIFLLTGMPDYYLQYATVSMILFVLLLLIPISFILYIVFKPVRKERRLNISLWYAFYFTIPLAIFDSLYCGIYLGYGLEFLFVFWFLTVYYFIPWLLFPAIAITLNRLRG